MEGEKITAVLYVDLFIGQQGNPVIKHFLEVNGPLSQPNGQIFKQNAFCTFIARYFCWYVSYISWFGPI